MKRGFTLIEILVVISIISMLSSILVANVSPARAKTRDSIRVQQVRQIDLAIQLYKANNDGKAPDLTNCAARASALSMSSAVSNCIADSSNPGAGTPWAKLKADLQPYISSIPTDPCGTNCTTSYGSNLAYVYYSPAYIQTSCGASCSGQSLAQLNQNYQLSAQLEAQNTQIGGSGGSSVVAPPIVTLSFNFHDVQGQGGVNYFTLDWSAINTSAGTPCFLTATNGYYSIAGTWQASSGGSVSPTRVPATITATCYGPGGMGTNSMVIQ